MRRTIIKCQAFLPRVLLSVLLLLVLLISAAMVGAQHTPSLLLKPTSGKAAAALAITGSHFVPGEEIDIIMQVGDVFHGLGTARADVVVADPKGNFSVTTGIPFETPPGNYKIEATGNKGSTAVANIQVLP
jgi:hypothetical protein